MPTFESEIRSRKIEVDYTYNAAEMRTHYDPGHDPEIEIEGIRYDIDGTGNLEDMDYRNWPVIKNLFFVVHRQDLDAAICAALHRERAEREADRADDCLEPVPAGAWVEPVEVEVQRTIRKAS